VLKIPETLHAPAQIGRYRVLQNPRFLDDDVIKPLGTGGTSAVYLVEQDLLEGQSIRRALKLFSPTDEVKNKRAAIGETYGKRHFLDEVAVVSGITHQNIVGIIDAGIHENDPFFVMDYVDGPTLETLLGDAPEAHAWAKDAQEDPHLVTRLAQQICWPLAYLHARRRFHFDIAPKNIFLRQTHGKPHLLLGDLGVSRYVPPAKEIDDLSKEIFVAGTKAYTPPALEKYRKANAAPLEVLVKLAAHWDVFALGSVILELIETWSLSTKRELAALKLLCERMIDDPTLDADKVSSALDRLLPAHVLTVGIEELSTDASGKRRYINVPLAPVPASERVRDVLDHPVVNRLQLVPQLLLYRSVTPGGVHTAFESLLGSYGMALRCVTKLLAEPRFRVSFLTKEHEETLIATLLSRIDKMPLDRIIRLVEPDRPGARRQRLDALLSEKPDGSPVLRDVLTKRFRHADLDAVVNTLAGNTDGMAPYQLFTRSLIESSISARALDYLQRDAHHTGIPAGAGIDAGNIIESLRWSETDNTLGITRAGVTSAEHMLYVY
jgi:serine/threonine protein kinase